VRRGGAAVYQTREMALMVVGEEFGCGRGEARLIARADYSDKRSGLSLPAIRHHGGADTCWSLTAGNVAGDVIN